jgi:hypothetical protein
MSLMPFLQNVEHDVVNFGRGAVNDVRNAIAPPPPPVPAAPVRPVQTPQLNPVQRFGTALGSMVNRDVIQPHIVQPVENLVQSQITNNPTVKAVPDFLSLLAARATNNNVAQQHASQALQHAGKQWVQNVNQNTDVRHNPGAAMNVAMSTEGGSLNPVDNAAADAAKAAEASAARIDRTKLSGKALSTPNRDLTMPTKPALPTNAALDNPTAGAKPSRFANVTVQNSDKVDALTKQLTQEKNVRYTPQATKAGQDLAAQTYGKMNLSKATLDVTNVLNDTKPGAITRQDVFNAHEVANRLQQTGDTADKATASDIYGKLSQHHTAAGQQIQAGAALAAQSPEGMLYSATKALQKGGVKVQGKVLDTLNNAIGEYKQTLDKNGIKPDKQGGVKTGTLPRSQADQQSLAYQKFVDTVNKQIPRGKGAAGIGIWRAGLLTGPETAAKVAVSHGITLPLELASKPVSAGVDALTSLVTGKRGYVFNPTDLKAGVAGYVKGAKAAGTKLTTGLDVPGTGGFEQKLGQSSRMTPYEAAPTRLHGSLAKPNFSAEYEMSLQSQARAEALNQNLKGAQADTFIKNFVNKPSKEALQTAQNEAEHFTNQQKSALGQGAKAIQNWKPGGAPVGTILAPFTRIPGAIGTKGLVDWTPLGLGKAAGDVINGIRRGNFDQRAFSQHVGRSITGTGIAVTGYELMNGGRMTLQAPNDPKEKALWTAEGKQSNSVYVGGKVSKSADGTTTYKGGKWISLNAMGPAGITLGLGGGFANAQAQGKNIPTSLVQSGAAGGKVLASQPYLKGISGVANAVNDPTRYAQTFLDSTVGSIIPAASSQIARGTDATQRAYNPSIPGTLESKIPGVRQATQPAQLDTFGNSVSSGNSGKVPLLSGAMQTVNPFYSLDARNQNDPATQELQRLYTAGGSQNAPAFAAPQKSMTVNGQKTTLTPTQMNQYIANSGPIIHQGITNLLQNPDYQKLTDAQKTSQINDIITGARTAAKVAILNDNPKTLTSTDKAAILNPQSLGKDITIPGLNLAPNIDAQSKGILTKVAGMTSADKTKYLNDPKNKYQYNLATYNNDALNGKYDSVQQFTRQNSLAKEAVTSGYSKQVSELYGMSKAEISNYLTANPNQASTVTDQLIQLDNQLYDSGLSTTLKFKNGVITSGSGRSSGKMKLRAIPKFKTGDFTVKAPKITVGKLTSPKSAFKAPKFKSYAPKAPRVTVHKVKA